MKQSELKTGKELIQTERERQISKEGWTIEHDDQHIHGELAKAADCYYEYAEDNDYADKKVHQYWPWGKEWWKPKDQLRDYIRAGALYRAEKERLERTGGAVGPKLTNLRIGIRQCEIKIDEILSHEAYCAKNHAQYTPLSDKTVGVEETKSEKLPEYKFRRFKITGLTPDAYVELNNEEIKNINGMIPCLASRLVDYPYMFVMPDGKSCHSDWLLFETFESEKQEKEGELISQMTEVFKWLLGHYDFPEPPKEGRPRYYWRSHLQEKLKEIGVNIKSTESPFQPRETDKS